MNKKGGSQTDTLVKLVLIFFISLLSFSVGTFVGKQFSDSQHKLANLEEDYGGQNLTASVENDDLQAQDGKVVTDQEVADLAREFVKAERQHMETTEYSAKATAKKSETKRPDAPVDVAKNQAAEKASPRQPANDGNKEAKDMKKVLGDVQNIAQKVAQKQAPVEPTTTSEKRHPSSLPPAVSNSIIGKYTVQIASYASEKEAETHARNLASKGFPAFYLPAEVKGKTWYRVSVGSFSAREQAVEFKTQLLQQAKINSAIVQKVTQ